LKAFTAWFTSATRSARNNTRLTQLQRMSRSASAALDDEFKLGLLGEALYSARWVVKVIPQPVFVTIGVENQRALAKLLFKAVGVELRLLLPDARIAAGALGFDQTQRIAVVSPQPVIHDALALVVGHPVDFELPIARLVQRPTRFLQQ